MRKPGATGPQFVACTGALDCRANAAGGIRQTASSASSITAISRSVGLLCYEVTARRWLPDIPLAAGITLDGRSNPIKTWTAWAKTGFLLTAALKPASAQ